MCKLETIKNPNTSKLTEQINVIIRSGNLRLIKTLESQIY